MFWEGPEWSLTVTCPGVERLVWGGGFTDNILLPGKKNMNRWASRKHQFPFLSLLLPLFCATGIKDVLWSMIFSFYVLLPGSSMKLLGALGCKVRVWRGLVSSVLMLKVPGWSGPAWECQCAWSTASGRQQRGISRLLGQWASWPWQYDGIWECVTLLNRKWHRCITGNTGLWVM